MVISTFFCAGTGPTKTTLPLMDAPRLRVGAQKSPNSAATPIANRIILIRSPFPPDQSTSPGAAPALGSDQLVVERRASARGAILAGIEHAVVAELRRVRALGRLRGIRFVLELDGG